MTNKQRIITEEVISYITNNWNVISKEEFIKEMNDKFDIQFCSDNALRQWLSKTKKRYNLSFKPHKRCSKFSNEEIEWINSNYNKYKNIKDLYADFKIYIPNSQMTTKQIIDYANQSGLRMDLIKTENGVSVPRFPIGYEKKDSRGVIMIKVSDIPNNSKSNWKEKSRYLYEKYIGELKPNNNIVHLNGNNMDFDLDNLYQVEKSVFGMMNKLKGWSDNKELTLLTIEYCRFIIEANKEYSKKEFSNKHRRRK